MFAVIVDGNRQHRVQEGSFLSVDYRSEVEAGSSITFDQVLLANGGGASVIGTPTISGLGSRGSDYRTGEGAETRNSEASKAEEFPSPYWPSSEAYACADQDHHGARHSDCRGKSRRIVSDVRKNVVNIRRDR